MVDGVGGLDVVGDEMGVGDHQIAAQHDRIVETLEAIAVAVSAMECGDETRCGAVGGGQGTPSRGAAAGMEDIDLVGLNEVAETIDIGAHGERVAAGQGQRHMFDTGTL